MANFNGTNAGESIFGTDQADVINGNGGGDSLYGYGGNDVITGSSSNDAIRGGSGDDVIYGNGGSDFLSGGTGDDKIYGGNQYDLIYGGSGNDVIYSNGGGDYIDSGSGLDTLWLGGKETVALSQGTGYDVVNNFQVHQGNSNLFNVSSYGMSFNDLSFTDTNNGVQIYANGDLMAVVANQTVASIAKPEFFF